jgi:hypothetical protein
VLQIAAAVDHANQVNAVFEREVEQENLLETVGDRKPADTFQLRFTSEERTPALGLSGQQSERVLGSLQEPVRDVDTGVLGVPNPLGNKVTLRGVAFLNAGYYAILRDLRASNCLTASRRMSAQSWRDISVGLLL